MTNPANSSLVMVPVPAVRPSQIAPRVTVPERVVPDLRVFEIPRPVEPILSQSRKPRTGVWIAGCVAALIGLFAVYLWGFAVDRYESRAGVIIRSDTQDSAKVAGWVTAFSGPAWSAEAEILTRFVHSPEMFQTVDQMLDVREHYASHWPQDVLFGLWPDASLNVVLWHWRRTVQLAANPATGLVELHISAYDPEFAQAIAQQIVAESADLVARLNGRMKAERVVPAEQALAEATVGLQRARTNIAAFRHRTQIIDPVVDLQSGVGVLADLQGRLAETLIEYDTLLHSTRPDDPRLTELRHTLDIIRERIATEHRAFLGRPVSQVGDSEPYPELVATYERLAVELNVAEERYRAALAALDNANADADQHMRRFETFLHPSLATTPSFPQRVSILVKAAALLSLAGILVALLLTGLRERR
ncbi:MAG: hypothetical protein AB3N23_04310 [Paracoccaceae bacterium]